MKLFVAVGLLFLVIQVFADKPASQDAPAVAKRGFPGYRSLGCWRDTHRRAIPYIGRVFGARRVRKCAVMARERGFKVFAVQAGTWCFGGAHAQLTYRKYGPVRNCVSGTGGGWANSVYQFYSLPYRSLGCWRDTHRRAIPYIGRVFGAGRVRKCAYMARKRGFKVFAVQAGTWCFGGAHAPLTYRKYGPARNCAHGTGGGWANDVYRLKRLAYVAEGCFRDKHRRALPVYLGYKRGDIGWCARQAKARGYEVFAVQYFGQCFSGPTAQATYNRYGAINTCRNGIGTAWSNYVYRFTASRKPGRKFRKINRRPVCFGARGNRPGVFRYYGPSRVVNGLLLVYRSGLITCHYHLNSRWGCGDANLIVVVTDQYNFLIYPRKEYIINHVHGRKGLWYRLPGKHSKYSKSLLLSNVASPFQLTTGMPLKVWYGEDLKNYTERDNRGRVCVDVFAWFA